MSHQFYNRKTKRFLHKNSKKLAIGIKKVSNLSTNLLPFEELPAHKFVEGQNGQINLNAFDLFEAFTSNIIHKKIIYAR